MYSLAAMVTVVVVFINLAPGAACVEGGLSAGRPFVYSYACDGGKALLHWTPIDGAALWGNAVIWGLVFGAVALAARLAWSMPGVTPGRPPGRRARP